MMALPLVRITFELDQDGWHGSATERLWSEKIGVGRYRLRNVPFFARGVGLDDIVFGVERDGGLFFAGVSIRGGHSTYRLRLFKELDSDAFKKAWRRLAELGCTFEEGQVIAIDVPGFADIYEVYAALEAGESAGVWDFEEGHCGHPLRAVVE